MNGKYLRHEGLLARWAYLPDNILQRGNPQSVPVWEFWMRATVITPIVVVAAAAFAYLWGSAIWEHPKSLIWIGMGLWFAAIIAGAVLKVQDKMNEDLDLPRHYIHFE